MYFLNYCSYLYICWCIISHSGWHLSVFGWFVLPTSIYAGVSSAILGGICQSLGDLLHLPLYNLVYHQPFWVASANLWVICYTYLCIIWCIISHSGWHLPVFGWFVTPTSIYAGASSAILGGICQSLGDLLHLPLYMLVHHQPFWVASANLWVVCYTYLYICWCIISHFGWHLPVFGWFVTPTSIYAGASSAILGGICQSLGDLLHLPLYMRVHHQPFWVASASLWVVC